MVPRPGHPDVTERPKLWYNGGMSELQKRIEEATMTAPEGMTIGVAVLNNANKLIAGTQPDRLFLATG